MPFGPELGDAYIDVHADTKSMPREMRRAARKAAQEFSDGFGDEFGDGVDDQLTPWGRKQRKAMAEEGRLGGKEYAKGWRKAGVDDIHRAVKDLDRSIRRGVDFGEWDKAADTFRNMDVAIKQIGKRLKELGVEGEEFDAAMRSLGKWASDTSMSKAHEEALKEDRARTKQRLREQAAELDEALAMNRSYDRATRRSTKERVDAEKAMLREAYQMNKDFNLQRQRADRESRDAAREQREAYRDMLNEAYALNQNYDRVARHRAETERENNRVMKEQIRLFRQQITDVTDANGGWERFSRNTHQRLVNYTRDLRASIGEGIDPDLFDRALAEVEENFNRRTRRMGRRANVSLFGRLKGSRNNFLNLMGSFAVGVERAGERIMKALFDPGGIVEGFKLGFSAIKDAFSENGIKGAFTEITSQIKGLGGSAGGAKGGILALVDVALQLTLAMGTAGIVISSLNIIVAGLSAAAGIAAAVIGSLGAAIIGALLPVGPILLGIAAGAGALFVLFKGKSKELMAAVKPITDWFTTFRKTFLSEIVPGIAKAMGGIKDLLNNFVGPLLLGAGQALTSAFQYLVDGFNSPDVQDTLTILSDTLPSILQNTVQALSDFLLGILGFFAAISPQTEDITGNIAGVAKQFNEWANSEDGRKDISDFFDKVWDSTQAWWDLITKVTEALGDLFGTGKTTGDDFVTSLTGVVDEFLTWFNQKGGREEVKGWFESAKTTASELWKAVQKVGEMFDKLDTPKNREALNTLIDLCTKLLEAVTEIADFMSEDFGWAFDAAASGAKIALDAISLIVNRVKGDIDALKKALDAVKSVGKTIADSAGDVVGSLTPWNASGAIYSGPTRIGVGEAGPEAIVPLNRPLMQVAPEVRALSAIAQGKTAAFGNGAVVGAGTTVMPGAIQINNPLTNPELVANNVLDALVAAL